MSDCATDGAALFNALYDEHRRAVYAYLLGRCGDSETAADLLQETFLRVWRRLPDVREVPEARRRFYLLAIAKNLALDELRRRVTRQRYLADCRPAARAGEGDPAGVVSAQETAALLENAIRELPEDLRTVLALRVMADMNSAEIGASLNLPAGTVRYRLFEARRRLAAVLDSEQ